MAVDQRVDTVARTIFGEARGEPFFDRLAVGLVIYERAKRPGWWGDGIVEVCRKKGQFSAWNRGNPNREKLLHAESENPRAWNGCLNVARFVVEDCVDDDLAQFWGTKDPRRFPTHYIARWLSPPYWLEGSETIPTPVDTLHLFYAGVEGTPRRKAL